jgi:hypothetical protein
MIQANSGWVGISDIKGRVFRPRHPTRQKGHLSIFNRAALWVREMNSFDESMSLMLAFTFNAKTLQKPYITFLLKLGMNSFHCKWHKEKISGSFYWSAPSGLESIK